MQHDYVCTKWILDPSGTHLRRTDGEYHNNPAFSSKSAGILMFKLKYNSNLTDIFLL